MIVRGLVILNDGCRQADTNDEGKPQTKVRNIFGIFFMLDEGNISDAYDFVRQAEEDLAPS